MTKENDMTPTEQITKWLAADGGVLVAVDFYNAAGNPMERGGDSISTDMVFMPGGMVAYFTVQGRVRQHMITSSIVEGEEVMLNTTDWLRLRVGPLWLPEQVSTAKMWKSTAIQAIRRAELEEVLQ